MKGIIDGFDPDVWKVRFGEKVVFEIRRDEPGALSKAQAIAADPDGEFAKAAVLKWERKR